MNPKRQSKDDDDMLPEYDFSNAVRGKYYEQYRRGTNVVLLDPDVADVFPNATAVNDALRALVAVADASASRSPAGTLGPKARRSTGRARRTGKKPAKSRAARG
jgi:hypothetical protein